jgi:hypothetical protein
MSQVEYRLARDAVVRDYHRGRLSRLDICDAQPELMRVAENLGEPTKVDCPICEQRKLVHVSFAFGPRLPSSGRALESFADLWRYASQRDVSCYLIEVCTACSWNHLMRLLTVDNAPSRLRA